jgi:hypothetical protein
MPASSKDQQAWPASIFGFVTGVFNSLSAEKSPQTNSNKVVNAVVTIHSRPTVKFTKNSKFKSTGEVSLSAN